MKKITIIGAGNLGSSIAKGLINKGYTEADKITLVRRNQSKLASLKSAGFNVSGNNRDAVKGSGIIILCVQPKQADDVIKEIAPHLNHENQILISTITGVSTEELSKSLGGNNIPVIRAMPNIAISIGASMTCLCSLNADETHLMEGINLFSALGAAIVIEERLMKAATVIGASNIAFFMRMIRATTQGGIQLGFSSEDAQAIAVQVAKGAALLLESNDSHPELEIDKVTTPQGCTIEGLNEMEHQGLSSAIIKGLVASYEKISNIR